MLASLLRVWRRLPLPLRMAYLRVRYARFAVGVSALIRDGHGRVVLVRRTYDCCFPWALPGGWLELGDDLAATAEREFLEETGLRVRAGPPLATLCDGFCVRVLLAADLAPEETLADFRPSPEVDALAWFAPPQLPRLPPQDLRLMVLASMRSPRHPTSAQPAQ